MTSPDNVDLSLNLDAAGYVSGAHDAAAATTALAGQYDSLERRASVMGKVWDSVTPGRALTAGFAAATASAASWQQQMTGIAARAAVTESSLSKIGAGVQKLARQFPIGTKGAIEMVEAIQQLGITGDKQTKTLTGLSSASIKLGAATGTTASVVGSQLLMLNRSFGAADSNVKRFTAMGDSLTEVQAKIGGNANEILSFSKAIAPFARQAGIGQTAVMGISSAFSKMGEDGFAASNTMNKVLADLNRSVRDGSGEMGTYANIVGKTRKEFEALFKAKPSQALSEVFTALAAPGATGQRNAERIGLDGTRSQRVAQAIGQQGGFQHAADVAIAGYGSGATSHGAHAAENTLVSEFEKLATASSQVTTALGRPFLGAITKVLQVAGTPMQAGAGILNSGPVQALMKYAAPALVGLGAARILGGLGNNSSMARQLLANNTLTQSFRQGRTGEGPFADRVRAGTAGRVARTAFGAGEGYQGARDASVMARTQALVAQGMDPADAYARASQGPSVASRVASGVRAAPRTAMNIGRYGLATYNAVLTDSSHQLRTADAGLRQGTVLNRAGLGGLRDEMKAINSTGASAGQRLGMMGASLKNFGAQANASSSVLSSAGKMAANSLGTTITGLRALGATATAVGGKLKAGAGEAGLGARAGGLAKGAFNLAGGVPGVAVMGGLMMYSANKDAKARTEELVSSHASASISGTMDAYRESTGRATEAVQTFAQQIASATKAVSAQEQTYATATHVSAEDEREARTTRNKTVHQYDEGADAAELAAQIRAMSPTGMDVQDTQGVKVDLLRQFGRGKTQDVMSLLAANQAGQSPQGLDFGAILDPSSGQMGLSVKEMARRELAPHGRGDNIALSKDQQRAVDLANEGVGQTRAYNENQYGADYAKQEAGRQANAAFKAAQETGNVDLEAAIAKTMGMDLSGKKVDTDAARNEDYRKLQNGEISLTDFLATQDKSFGKEAKTKGIDYESDGGLKPHLIDSALTTATNGIDTFGKALSNRTEDVDDALNKTVTAFLATPGDTKKMSDAMDALAGDVAASGGGLDDLAGAALQTATAMHDTTSEVSKLALAIQARAINDNQANAGFQGRAETLRVSTNIHMQQASNTDQGDLGASQREAGRTGLQQDREGYRQMFAARLQQQYDFQKQSARAEHDYTLSRERTVESFGIQVARAEEDFGISRFRAQRDFNIQLEQGEEDFQTSRMRAHRDFNKQMKRANEDAAKAMYDPYKRMQVQATSDATTLLANLAEQNEALRAQEDNLNRLRKAGLSNDTIDQLGLNKAENAQQAARMAGDVANDPGIARAMNSTIKTRMGLAGNLASDESQKDRSRALEDFNQSLTDQETDYKKSLSRSKAAFNKSMADSQADYRRAMARQQSDFARTMAQQETDFHTTMARQKQDIEDSNKEILGSLEDLQAAVFDVMNGKAVDFAALMHSTLADAVEDAKTLTDAYPTAANGAVTPSGASTGGTTAPSGNYGNVAVKPSSGGQGHINDPDMKAGSTSPTYVKPGQATVYNGAVTGSGAGTEYSPSSEFMRTHPVNKAFNQSIARALAPGWAKGDQWNALVSLWNGESGWNQYADNGMSSAYGIPQALPGDKMKTKGADWRTNPATQISWGLSYIKDRYGDPVRALNKWKSRSPHWYAKGGIAMSPHVGVVAEAGAPEAMIPLNTQGVAKLAEAMTMYLDHNQASRIQNGRTGDKVVYSGNEFVYDHSTKINGEVTVHAADLSDLLGQLQAKARQANLTATATRKIT